MVPDRIRAAIRGLYQEWVVVYDIFSRSGAKYGFGGLNPFTVSGEPTNHNHKWGVKIRRYVLFCPSWVFVHYGSAASELVVLIYRMHLLHRVAFYFIVLAPWNTAKTAPL